MEMQNYGIHSAELAVCLDLPKPPATCGANSGAQLRADQTAAIGSEAD